MADSKPTRSKVFVATEATNQGNFGGIDWLLFVSIGAIWGASFLFIDIGLDALPPAVITWARVGLGAAALAVLPRKRIPIEKADRPILVLLGTIWVALPFTLFPLAQEHINSSVTGLLNGSTPILAALVGAAFLKQFPSGPLLAGIAVGFVGIILIAAPSLSEGSSEALGVMLVVGATACYAFSVNIAPPMQAKYGPVNLMFKLLMIGTVLTTPFALAQIGDAKFETGPWVAVAVLGVVGTGIAFAIMAALLGRVGPTRGSLITYVIPVVALFLGVIFREDEVAPIALVGVGLVLVGAFLASRKASRPATSK